VGAERRQGVKLHREGREPAKEQKSLTAKDAEDAKKKKSFTAKDAKVAKGTIIKNQGRKDNAK
jgi:hypothetical protein